MKVAITSSGDSVSAKLDGRFGRCAYFVIYDTETGAMEITPNPNKDSVEGAGTASVQFVASKGAKKVVSGEFGAKVKNLFDSLQIQLVVLKDPDTTVEGVIKMLGIER